MSALQEDRARKLLQQWGPYYPNSDYSWRRIPSGFTSIGRHAFQDQNVGVLILHDKITSIEFNAFRNSGLIEITIPDSVTSIEQGAFSNNQLSSIEIPSSVKTVKSHSFSSNRLTSVDIPFGVTRIEGFSFDRNDLTAVSIPSSVVIVDSGAFDYNPLETISVSKYHDASWMKYADWMSDNTEVIRRDNEAPRDILFSLEQVTERKESNSEIARLSTIDEYGDNHSYAFVLGEGSVDNDLFSIDGDLIRINQVPNYANRDHYSIRVQTKDLDGLTFEKSLTLSLESPIDLHISSNAFDENITAGTAVATLGNTNDGTNDYTLISGDGSDHNNVFSIIDNQLIIQKSPDFESQESYNIRISFKDSMDLSYGRSFILTVNNINETPTTMNLSRTSFDENIAEGYSVALLTTGDEDTTDTYTYNLVSGDGSEDNDAFKIADNRLIIKESPDFETQDSYNIRLRTTDSGGLTFEKSLTLTVNDQDEPPTSLNLSDASLYENIAGGSAVAYLTTSDQDTRDTHTYDLVSGDGSEHNDAFGIIDDQIIIKESPDYETQDSYNIRLRTTDSTGLTFEKAFTLNVNNQNEPPTSLDLSDLSFYENIAPGSTVAFLTTSDDKYSEYAYTYTLVQGDGSDDNAAFAVDDLNKLIIEDSPDFETQDSYNIRLRITDPYGNALERTITLTVYDQEETHDPTFQNIEWVEFLDLNPEVYSGMGITIGSDGSIYITGSIYSFDNIDGSSINGPTGAFIAKYNSDGDKEWMQLLDSQGYDGGTDIATGSDGSIYVTGYTTGNIDDKVNNGSHDTFIAKYNRDGSKAWLQIMNSSQFELGQGIVIGGDGSIYVCGTYFDSSELYPDTFIAKYNSDGTKAWTQLLGTMGSEIGLTVANKSRIGSDENGSIYVTGSTKGDLQNNSNTGKEDVFIAKYDSNGNKVWTKLLGSRDYDEAFDIATGSDGFIYITGYTRGNLDGKTIRVVTDTFIAKYNSDGRKEWIQLSGSSSNNSASGITTGSDESIYITGSQSSFDSGNLSSSPFVAKFNTDGSKKWTQQLEIPHSGGGQDIATGSDGSIYIVGNTRDDNDLPVLFIAKYSSIPDANPTDITLSGTSFNENLAEGSLIATLSTIDADTDDGYTYTLVSGDGSEHNDAFEIINDQIIIKESPDYETHDSYNIRLKTTDFTGLTFEKTFTLTVNDLPEKNFDFNGDGKTTLEHDAIIGLRMMFGTFPGDALIDGAITPESTEGITDIQALMSDAIYDGSLDLDSDGIISPFTDGLKLIEEIHQLQSASISDQLA